MLKGVFDMSAILKSDNLKLLDDKFDETYKLFLFNPTMFKLFPKSGNMHKLVYSASLTV